MYSLAVNSGLLTQPKLKTDFPTFKIFLNFCTNYSLKRISHCYLQDYIYIYIQHKLTLKHSSQISTQAIFSSKIVLCLRQSDTSL
jgi:hypothetical protein